MRIYAALLSTIALLLGGVFLPPPDVSAEQGNIFFERVDKDDGLSNRSVSSIVQDGRGFLWFGTQSGLNRYDGYDFQVYKKEPFNRNSLSHDLIQTLYMEDGRVLWIGTYQGLNRLDLATEEFQYYGHNPDEPKSLSNNVVVSILKDSAGNLWVGTLDGLNRLDRETNSFVHYFHDPDDPNSPTNDTIRALYEDSRGRVWAGTYGGLLLYRPESDDFIRYSHDLEDPDGIASDNVMAIADDEEGYLWLATWGGGGLSRFDPRTGRAVNYELPDTRSYSLSVEENGLVYVGSWGGGLIGFDRSDRSIRQFTRSQGSETGLNHDIVYSLHRDNSGVLWIGTNGGGINKMKEPDNNFRYWSNDTEDPNSLSPGKVNAVYKDSQGYLWVGTYNGGLNRIDEQSGEFRRYRHDPDQVGSLSNDIVTRIFEDSRENLWVVTNDGLDRYNRRIDGFERWFGPEDGISLPDQIVYAITEDLDGSLWIGTYSEGLMRYFPDERRAEYYSNQEGVSSSLSDNLVYDIFLDSWGELWVGTNKGLNRFDREKKEFVRYLHDPDDPNSLSSDTVRRLFEDAQGRLWLATVSGGLNRYRRESDNFVHYMQDDGLPANTIYGILEDNRGRLWISTMDNLTIFDPQSDHFLTVDEDNGIWAQEFAPGHYGDRDSNVLYFGTNDGLYRILPGDFSQNSHIPPVCITSFKVFDEEVEFPEALYRIEEFEVDFQDKFIAFEFAALDFVSPEKNQYAYRLEGFDEDWIYSGNRRYASYTNLAPGEYVFRVKASNNDGIWNNEGRSVKLRVIPPFWRTTAAYLLYTVAILTLLYLGVREYGRRQRTTFEQQTRELERRRLAELEEEVEERRRVEAQLIRAKELAEEANRSTVSYTHLTLPTKRIV